MSEPVSVDVAQQVQLRYLSPTDIPVVKKLCAEWFPIQYPDCWFEAITTNSKFHTLAAIFDSNIIGFIVSEVKWRLHANREDANILASHFPLSTHVAYILSLGVVDAFRRHGIASLLLESLLSYLTSSVSAENCKAVYLHVLSTNAVAIRFYERLSFLQHKFLPYYYAISGRRQDGYCYVLYINGGQPQWTITDYVRHVGQSLGKLQPCLLPQRLMLTAQKLWRRLIPIASPTRVEPAQYASVPTTNTPAMQPRSRMGSGSKD